MIFLDVPYSQKDDAKALGARWNAEAKKWHVPDGALATPFERWMPGVPAGATRIASSAAQPKRASRREDDAVGVIVVGAGYTPVEGASGPPWD